VTTGLELQVCDMWLYGDRFTILTAVGMPGILNGKYLHMQSCTHNNVSVNDRPPTQ
jgi:hypothetical protein